MRKLDAYMAMMGDMHKVASYCARLRDEGVAIGIAFEFEGSTSATFDAHRLAEWALDTHGDDAKDRLVEAQLSQYLEAGLPPNSIDAQVAAASAAGLDALGARRILEDKQAFADVTQRKLAEARGSAVSGVPCFRIDGKVVATGAQTVDWWEDELRKQLLRHTK